MKKFLILSAVLLSFSLPAFSKTGFEFGIGSGYVFYGSQEVKDRNKAVGSSSNQTVLETDAAMLFPLSEYVIFSVGADTLIDFRWKGSNNVNLIDYAGLLGFRVYPGLGGFFVSVDYALGRRTDVISIGDNDTTESTKWGNGFKLGIAYDFSYHLRMMAPVLSASIKSMPRGGSRDTVFVVGLKLTRH